MKEEALFNDIEALKGLQNFIYDDYIDYDSMHHIRIPKYYDDSGSNNDDHVILWLADNTNGKWSSDMIGDYYFEFEEDAMAFKLRWM